LQNLKTTGMHSSLIPHWHKLEAQRNHISRLLEQLPDARFVQTPPYPGWSLAEVLAHLITVERLSLDYMKKKATNWAQCGTAGPGSLVRLGVLVVSLRLPLKFRAPAVVQHHTPPVDKVTDALASWQAVRDDLHAFLHSIPPSHQKKLVYKHPVAGRFSTWQALLILSEHLRHHLPQIKRLLKKNA